MSLEPYTLYFLLDFEPQHHQPAKGPSSCYGCFLACCSFLQLSPFLECDFPSSLALCQLYLLSLLQELFHKHLSAVELPISPLWSVEISVCPLHSYSCPSVAVAFLEPPEKAGEDRG